MQDNPLMTADGQLKCDCCGGPAIGVASSCIPISFAYCMRCLQENVEPEFIFAYHYDEVSIDGKGLADWFTQCAKTFKDGEIWDWPRYVKWRHDTGRGKSEPCDPPPPLTEEEQAEFAASFGEFEKEMSAKQWPDC